MYVQFVKTRHIYYIPGGPAEVLDEATDAAVTGLEAAESV
jgi:hypothetical protein